MSQNKTNETEVSVTDFLNSLKDDTKRQDSFALIEIVRTQLDIEPKMWGPSIVGFGSYHYQYDSGRTGDSPLMAFSPRAAALVLYLAGELEEREELLQKLGKHKTEKGCVYIKKLADVNLPILEVLIKNHISYIRKQYA
jgi:hypothetical protein